MDLRPITYRIACHLSTPEVHGYAIRLPAPFAGLRFCVRRTGREWGIDHYDSGMGIFGPVINVDESDPKVIAYMRHWQLRRETRLACVGWLVRWLHHLRNSNRLRSNGAREWLQALEEAGL